MRDFLKSFWLYPLPHHLVSRLIFALTRMRTGHTPAIRWFVKQFDINLQEAANPDINTYPTFNAFFTRALKADARPLDPDPQQWLCPCDGTVSALGDIDNDRIFQAKGHDYSLTTLLGGDAELASRYVEGSFLNVYLSPRDYHRIHIPANARLRQQIHVPGRLFSVAPHTVRCIPALFARNERVIAEFDSDFGPLAVVMVGAINVAAIETVWSGLVTPPQKRQISRLHFEDQTIRFGRGEEIGRFNMGSTVIILTGKRSQWRESLATGVGVKMGESTGRTID